MSVGYRAVQWNRQKYIYDGLLIAAVLAYLGLFFYGAPLLVARIEENNLAIRAFGSAAFLLLHVILSIGPLARIDQRFLPFLYNRRHMGVTMCLLGLLHANAARSWYHQYGLIDSYVSLLVGNVRFDSLVHFPFELLGIAALLILVTMAVTSHDFWLHNLSAPVWKSLHMLVYVAYALIVGHVLLGALQSNRSLPLAGLMVLSVAWIVGVHVAAARREQRVDRESSVDQGGWIRVGPVDDIPLNRAKVVFAGGERIAVFHYGEGKVAAISAVCQHQNGPLGEGQIIDGLVTCPWHGFQYDPETGASPPPFKECVPTFQVKVVDGVVHVGSTPNAPGTRVQQAQANNWARAATVTEPFYVGYLPKMAPALRAFVLPVICLLMLGVLGAAPMLLLLHTPYAEARSDAAEIHVFEGLFLAYPVPHLVVPRPNAASHSRYLMTGLGKYGVKPKDLRAAGGWARVRGSLVYRDEGTLLLVRGIEPMATPIGAEAAIGDEIRLGRQVVRGEIVDSKCYLGVMRPGNTKTHRGCAVRCIAGGIPPMLLAQDEAGNSLQLLLVGPSGESINQQVLPYVAEPVEVAGELLRLDDLLVLRIDPSVIRRL